MIHRKYLEALLFATVRPLSAEDLMELLEIDQNTLEVLIKEYEHWLKSVDSGLCLRKIGQTYQLVSAKECFCYVEKIRKKEEKLSAAALETLAIVAFKQPITKGEIEEIRGVNCDNLLRQLQEKELIMQMGRKEIIGRPILYGTTSTFLSSIGLNSLEDLQSLLVVEEIPHANKVEER